MSSERGSKLTKNARQDSVSAALAGNEPRLATMYRDLKADSSLPQAILLFTNRLSQIQECDTKTNPCRASKELGED